MAEGQQIEALDLGSDDEAITDADTDSAGTDLKHVRMEAEYQRIQQAITQCNGNKTAAAKRLGISRASLYQKLSSHR